MGKKDRLETDRLQGFSARVVTPPSPENGVESSDSKVPSHSVCSTDDISQTAVDQADPFVAGEEHDGWTIQRLQRRSSIPFAQSESVNPRESASSISDTRTLKELPHTSTSKSIPVTENQGGGAFDLVDRSRSSQIALDMKEEMEELYGLGEFSGALRIAELVLGARPDDQQAQLCAENSRLKLEQRYSSKIGPLSQVPIIDLSDAEIRWLGLDHRAGFVLSRIDNQSTIEELVDVCGMSSLELFKTLIELLNRGAIHFERR